MGNMETIRKKKKESGWDQNQCDETDDENCTDWVRNQEVIQHMCTEKANK